MGTYRTTRIPGTRDEEARRLLGVNSLGQQVFLTRACPPGHPSRALLERFVKTPVDLREIAGLVEIAEDESGVWVVEAAEPSLPLQVALDRAAALSRPLAPELAAWLAMRVCQACAGLRQPHLRLSLRNVLVRPDGEPYLLGAHWARTLPPEPDDRPFVPPQPVDDTNADAYAAAMLARALAGAGGHEAFPAPLKAALEAASGGPGWSWMLTSADAAKALEQALGPEAVRTGASRVSAWLLGLELQAPAPFDPASPPLRLAPVNRLNTSEEPALSGTGALPGGAAMSIDGRIEGAVGRGSPSSAGLFASDAPQVRMSLPAQPEELELDQAALVHAQAPAEIGQGSMVHKVQQEMERVRARRRNARVLAVLGLVVVVAVGALGAWYLQRHPAQLEQLMGQQVTSVLRIESTPPGATLTIGGETLGETPYVGLNDYAGGTARAELAGYEPATAPIGDGSRTIRLVLVPKPGTKVGGPKRVVPLQKRPTALPALPAASARQPDPEPPAAADPATSKALEAGREEVKKDQAEAAKKLGGTMGGDGQFVDPDLAKEKRRK